MRWFLTLTLPLLTLNLVYLSIKWKKATWKPVALILGCGFMVSGFWLTAAWTTLLVIAGGVLFFVGLPRGIVAQPPATGVERVPIRAAHEPGTARIHISFPRPGFFLNDVRVVLLLDGATIYEGGFKAGIDVTIPAAPGSHRLESVLDLGLAKRRRTWEIAASAMGCDVVLEYSRFWGNFSKNVRISALTTGVASAGAA